MIISFQSYGPDSRTDTRNRSSAPPELLEGSVKRPQQSVKRSRSNKTAVAFTCRPIVFVFIRGFFIHVAVPAAAVRDGVPDPLNFVLVVLQPVDVGFAGTRRVRPVTFVGQSA